MEQYELREKEKTDQALQPKAGDSWRSRHHFQDLQPPSFRYERASASTRSRKVSAHPPRLGPCPRLGLTVVCVPTPAPWTDQVNLFMPRGEQRKNPTTPGWW